MLMATVIYDNGEPVSLRANENQFDESFPAECLLSSGGASFNLRLGQQVRSICIYLSIHLSIQLSIYTYTYVYTYIHIYVYVYVYTHTHTYIFTYIPTYMHIYIYI